MLFVSLIRWWYGPGWLDQLRLVRERFDRTADLFSIELSFKTLFKPFRQIDADRVGKGSLSVILQAWFDRIFSRFVGSIARTFLIIIGSVAIAVEGMIGVLRLTVWPLLPCAPLFSLLFIMAGWAPWH